MPSSPAAVADWGEETAGGDAGDLGETVAVGDDARGEAVDLGDVDMDDATRGGVAVSFGDVAACVVESAIVGPVLDMSVPARWCRTGPRSERAGRDTPSIYHSTCWFGGTWTPADRVPSSATDATWRGCPLRAPRKTICLPGCS